jgi:hypothetical protein
VYVLFLSFFNKSVFDFLFDSGDEVMDEQDGATLLLSLTSMMAFQFCRELTLVHEGSVPAGSSEPLGSQDGHESAPPSGKRSKPKEMGAGGHESPPSSKKRSKPKEVL